ncbi:MAG: Ribonucleoside-diphosphate reductase [Parcubacteria group bacterium GW2011_GWD2_38_12]|nr:MAG: Ribonucleoside-diphosphate reductase [Parcubacteria group bacterium GW2011_GWD2_38_12]KKQ58113.1 MAG: Ribonucleoside-diphosphate reductase [Parcubacteria group bacterium GW2011_GWD1_38_16]KKQ58932.1 MAG: Ribonucleoside-diphosphate reductase [Parcubacteria group bacterium GW2011_GWC1_38_17]
MAVKTKKQVMISKKIEHKVDKIKKRDNRIVPFDQSKITNAIKKSFFAVKEENGVTSKKVSNEVVKMLNQKYAGKIPGVENIQDLVIATLRKMEYEDVADAYDSYRKKRSEIREAKYFLLSKNVRIRLTPNAMKVLESRYLRKDDNGKIIETPSQLYQRVAQNVASAEKIYNPGISDDELFKTEEKFYRMMATLEFLPNSPTLMNAGSNLQQLSACFVLPVEDAMESIFEAVKDTALIHQSGGGTGFSFTHLRPKGDRVKSTSGVASGPISFMTVFDSATNVVKQGGKRRGANMGILRVDHPDILEFIICKDKEGFLENFNISVALTNEFMDAVMKKKKYQLINPRDGQVWGELDASEVFDKIVKHAWNSGDPGIIFIDRINDKNPTPKLGRIEATNPCGEQPLLPFESCNLGSINLAKMIILKGKKYEIDWGKLCETVRNAVHFLDNVIDMNRYPLPEIEAMTKGNRKIGLGIMAFADMLVKMEISYASQKAVDLAEKIMKFIDDEADKMSEELAKKRGVFPNWIDSVFDVQKRKMRNATTTTIAPTGTIGIIAGVSQGVEPIFALAYTRLSYIGKNSEKPVELLEVNPLFEEVAKREGFYSEEVMKKIAHHGSTVGIKEIPKKWQDIFATAHDIIPEWHVKMQAAFQKFTDNAVSKTINYSNEATLDDVKNGYMLAYKTGCKGITIYRSGSKQLQILNVGIKKEKANGEKLKIEEKVEKTELTPELLNPSPDVPDITPGTCPTCESK